MFNYYTYDNQDRIIKVHRVGNTYSDELNYNYDSNGNLVRTGYTLQGQPIPLVYDNQVNPQRTNEVYMFVARDYSRNNAMPAESYNDKGLPLLFRQQSRTVTFLGADIANAEFFYQE
jgi:YD repeat-containing protein